MLQDHRQRMEELENQRIKEVQSLTEEFESHKKQSKLAIALQAHLRSLLDDQLTQQIDQFNEKEQEL